MTESTMPDGATTPDPVPSSPDTPTAPVEEPEWDSVRGLEFLETPRKWSQVHTNATQLDDLLGGYERAKDLPNPHQNALDKFDVNLRNVANQIHRSLEEFDHQQLGERVSLLRSQAAFLSGIPRHLGFERCQAQLMFQELVGPLLVSLTGPVCNLTS
jgi:hypothetical protein